MEYTSEEMRFKTASFASVRWTPQALSSEHSTSGLHPSAWMPGWKNPLELTTARRRRELLIVTLRLERRPGWPPRSVGGRPSVACLRPVGKLLTGMPSYRMQRLKFVVECWPQGQVGCSPCPSRNFCFLTKEHDCLRISAPQCDHQHPGRLFRGALSVLLPCKATLYSHIQIQSAINTAPILS